MVEEFQGYHSEWNLGCPGGWEYQRMAQVRGELCWRRVKQISGIEIELDFAHPILNPVPLFIEMLLRAHRKNFQQEKPYILLVAEAETLDKVTENINLVESLNRMEGINAALTCPQELEEKDGDVFYNGQKATVIFLDINNDVLRKIAEKHHIGPLLSGIKKGIVVNPRGLEPVGAKGVFEAVTGDLSSQLSASTVKFTPWTRLFYPCKTTGPQGEVIEDLVEWVRDHWGEVILKPVYGYSGKGILVGPQSDTRDEDIQIALEDEPYIVQAFISKELWAEEYPWLDLVNQEVRPKQWQTDFRCFVSDEGLIGFLARFGGIPTNVGAGGGGQAVAILASDIAVRDAVHRINSAIIEMGFSTVMEIQQEVDEKGLELKHTYLKGPTPTTLRPRIISPSQLTALRKYSANLWVDLLKLEKWWHAGKLNHLTQLGEGEAEIARLQFWGGSPALIASDGLFSFGADLMKAE